MQGMYFNMRHVKWGWVKYEGITQIFMSRTTRDHTYLPLTHHHLFSTLTSLNIRTSPPLHVVTHYKPAQ